MGSASAAWRQLGLVFMATVVTGLGLTGCGVSADASGAAPDDSFDDEGPEAQMGPARGISIVEVEANQGTRVVIGAGGRWVTEAERSVELIAGRDTAVRVHYEVEPGWSPREIEARLNLELPDGSSTVLSQGRRVEASSSRAAFDEPFLFVLDAELGLTAPGVRYAVELWEVEAGGEGSDAGDWQTPDSGPASVGFVARPLELQVVVVPFVVQGREIDLDLETELAIRTQLYEQNPVTAVDLELHPPVEFDGVLNSLSGLLPILATLRSDEGAAANVYYHALVDVGSQSLGGISGVSYVANDSKDDAASRVSATVLWTPDPSIAVDTFVHEIGHAQGLAHVACPDAEADAPNLDFPEAEGHLGDWGFAVRRELVFDPDRSYDYMSYCEPSWVSPWTWSQTLARIETLTAWDFEGPAPESEAPAGELLVGAIGPDGAPTWWTMPGTIDEARTRPGVHAELETRAGEHLAVPVDVAQLSDGVTTWVKIPLDRPLDQLRSLRLSGFESGFESVELDSIR